MPFLLLHAMEHGRLLLRIKMDMCWCRRVCLAGSQAYGSGAA